MAETVQVSGRTTNVVVNAGPANLVVRGEGDPEGATLGEIAVESTDTAQVAATWTASARGYSATAGPASQLHCPTSRAKTQLGFLVAFRKGADTIPTSGPFIPYGNGGDYPLEVDDAGEEVTLRYTVDDAGLPPHFVVVPVANRAVSETTTIILSQANAAPDTSLTKAELDALRARQATDEGRIAALERRPTGTGGQSERQVSDAIADALAAYRASPALLGVALDTDEHTLTFTGRDASGNAATTVVHYNPTATTFGDTQDAKFTVADQSSATRITGTQANTPVDADLDAVTGAGVTDFLVPSVVGGKARVTLPKAGFGRLHWHDTLTIGPSSAGDIEFTVRADHYGSDGTLKNEWAASLHLEAVRGSGFKWPFDIATGLTPIEAGDYFQFRHRARFFGALGYIDYQYAGGRDTANNLRFYFWEAASIQQALSRTQIDTLITTALAAYREQDIGEAQLAQALQDLINGKANTADLDRLISNSATVRALTDFEASLRHQTQIATGTNRQAGGGILHRLPGERWPAFEAADDITVVVAYGEDASVSWTFRASDLRIAAQGDPASSNNSNQHQTPNQGPLFSVSNEDGNVLVSSSDIGDFAWTILLARTRIATPFVGDDQITESKLAADVRAKLNSEAEAGVTEDQVRAIADAEASKYVVNVDEVAHRTLRFGIQYQGRVAGEAGTLAADIGFTANGTAYTIGQLIRRSNGAIVATVTPIDSRADLRGYELDVGGERHDFSAGAFSVGDAENPDLYELPGPSAAFSTTEDTRVSVLEPPGVSVPKGAASQNGYDLKWNNARQKAVWAPSVGGYKLLSGPGAGLAIVNNTASVRGNLQLFRPGRTGYYDLGRDDLDRFLFVSVVLAMTGKSSTQVGYDPNSNPPDTIRLSGFVHLEEVAAASAYSNTADHGYSVFHQDVWEGAADPTTAVDLGNIELWAAQETGTEYLGYYFKWNGGDTTNAGNMYWNFGSTIRAYV